jgi:hypothetical protein
MSIIDHAKTELKLINFGDDDSRVMIELLEKFLEQWDSGGAVSVVAPVFQRLLAGKPLTPITGEDSEWFVHNQEGMYAQNIRCGSVFKDAKEGQAYDINLPGPGRQYITFPYWPDKADIPEPVFEVSRK